MSGPRAQVRRPLAPRDVFAARGFTLVEILVAMALSLVLMGMVVTVFGTVTNEIGDSRASVELADRLRAVQGLLKRDLEGVTVSMVPPIDPADNLGYFEYIEGPIGPVLPLRPFSSSAGTTASGFDLDNDGDEDTTNSTHGDFDDVLMFTSRDSETPFRGKALNGSISSPVAEVIWFLRGSTLYRRVLLVAPAYEQTIINNDPQALLDPGFYADYDLSVRQVGGPNDVDAVTSALPQRLVLNSLGDLTKRENRYGHQPYAYPHDARFWSLLGMPTLRECSFLSDLTDRSTGQWAFPLQTGGVTFHSPSPPTGWILPQQAAGEDMEVVSIGVGGSDVPAWLAEEYRIEEALADGFDPWLNPNSFHDIDPDTGTLIAYSVGDTSVDDYFADPSSGGGSRRLAEDVVLTNVLSFDVKIWDPGAPVLEYVNGAATTAVEPSDPRYIELMTVANARVVSFGAYVDLNYMCRLGAGSDAFSANYPPNATWQNTLTTTRAPFPWFNGPGQRLSQLPGTLPSSAPTMDDARAAVYDSWSTHYERDGIDQDGDGVFDEGADGLDNPTGSDTDTVHSNSLVGTRFHGIDDFYQQEAPPPYPAPLRTVHVTLRALDPASRAIRAATFVQDFVTPESGSNYQ